MSVKPPTNNRGKLPEPRPGRFSFLNSWFRWLRGWGEQRTLEPGPKNAADAYFSAVGDGEEVLPPTPRSAGLRGLTGSGEADSPLAAAYARSAESTRLPPMPLAPPKPQWKVVEPPASSDPVAHHECQFLKRSASWSLMGASIRGKLHAHHGTWRDDAFAWGSIHDWTCIAVADGAGSAPLSRIGARVACEEAVRSLTAALGDYRFASATMPSQQDLQRLRSLSADAARHAQASIVREAERRNAPLRDFLTTFLLLIHVPIGEDDLVGALQIGDGAVGLYTLSGKCTVLGDPDHGVYSGETRFLTTPNIEAEFERRTAFAIPRGLCAVAVLTDGVADDFFPEQQRLVELFTGDPIPDCKTPAGAALRGVFLGPTADPRGGKALADWLRYEKRGSSDDRTLVLLYRPAKESP